MIAGLIGAELRGRVYLNRIGKPPLHLQIKTNTINHGNRVTRKLSAPPKSLFLRVLEIIALVLGGILAIFVVLGAVMATFSSDPTIDKGMRHAAHWVLGLPVAAIAYLLRRYWKKPS